MIGGVLGAYVLTGLEASTIKPFVVGYLALVGVWILWRAGHDIRPRHLPAWVTAPLGLVGGFLDAVGGGGWGRPSPRPWSAPGMSRARPSAR